MAVVYDARFDYNDDDYVNTTDVYLMNNHQGATAAGGLSTNGYAYEAKYDHTGTGVIGTADFAQLLSAYGGHWLFRGVIPSYFASIWKQLIPGGATYTDAELPVTSFIDADFAYISTSTSFPVKNLTGRLDGRQQSIPVYCDPTMVANGSWNGCCRFLGTDGFLYEGQPLLLAANGHPSVGGMNRLEEDQIVGCHGGSGLSCGGTLLKGWESGGAIDHILGINLWNRFLNPSPAPFVSPAIRADGYALLPGDPNRYQGTGPVHMGSLLALKPDDNVNFITDPRVAKIAQAFKTYGGLVCDDTFRNTHCLHIQKGAVETTIESELQTVFTMLWVVT